MAVAHTALVIDDHPLMARGIANFLQLSCGFDSVKASSNIENVVDELDGLSNVAVILLDFWLPNSAFLPLFQHLKTHHPTIPLLVMSADDNSDIIQKVYQLGAQGFVHKQAAPDVFTQAVNALIDGKTWFNYSNPHAYQVNEMLVTADELGLTTRQGQILTLILNGLPNKIIAKKLSLSEQTIKEHVSGILSRLGVSNRIEAIKLLRGKKLE